MMKCAITATGTEIGKTHFACALLGHAHRQGLSCQPVKPVMSGFSEAELGTSDAGRLAKACGLETDIQSIADLCRHRFTPELAPNVAARNKGVSLDYDDILNFVTERLGREKGFSLVEGAGGLLSPMTDEKLNADLFADLKLPSFLVTAAYLGSVSHTLSSLESAQHRRISIAAIIVSKPTADFGDAVEFSEELERWTDIPVFQMDERHNPAPACFALLKEKQGA